jgi:pyruvate/2-oxoglutarate dehydrogenase complex dihydrolipoamide acyltransferase (E2) component
MRPSIYRRATIDVMRIARQVPMVPAQRRMQLGALAAARKTAALSWSAIFTKAYALTAREMPVLRRGYFRYPVPRFVDYPMSAAAIAVERELDGESVVCPLIVPDPASLSLAELAARIQHGKTAAVEDATEFARIRRVVGLPWPIRPVALWLGYVIPSARFEHYGTFGVTTVVSDGAELLNLVSPLPTVLSYGPMRENGEIEVRIMFDHRIVDAAPIARALVRLEQVLNGPIADEVGRGT